MAEKDLIGAISKRLKGMPVRNRREKVRQLASESGANKRFIKKILPDLYQEAFPSTSSSSAGAASGSIRNRSLAAKRR